MSAWNRWIALHSGALALVVSALALAAASCEGEDEEPSSDGSPEEGGAEEGGADTSGEDGGDATGEEGGGTIPSSPAALVPWLEASNYEAWDGEAAPHPSTGQHFGDVRAYFNPLLAASLSDGNGVHPLGSAAVKELLDDGTGEPRGWSVSIKTDASASGKDAWFWFEYIDGVQLVAEQGEPVCSTCHEAGTDFIRTQWP